MSENICKILAKLWDSSRAYYKAQVVPDSYYSCNDALNEICAEIKAAEDKREEEVLEMACSVVSEIEGETFIEDRLRQAYKERFGKQPTEPLSWGNIEPKH